MFFGNLALLSLHSRLLMAGKHEKVVFNAKEQQKAFALPESGLYLYCGTATGGIKETIDGPTISAILS